MGGVTSILGAHLFHSLFLLVLNFPDPATEMIFLLLQAVPCLLSYANNL